MNKFKVSVVRTQEQICVLEMQAENAKELRKILDETDFSEMDQKFDEGQVSNVYYDVRAIKKY